jgi:trimeric autotransporter adhesin
VLTTAVDTLCCTTQQLINEFAAANAGCPKAAIARALADVATKVGKQWVVKSEALVAAGLATAAPATAADGTTAAAPATGASTSSSSAAPLTKSAAALPAAAGKAATSAAATAASTKKQAAAAAAATAPVSTTKAAASATKSAAKAPGSPLPGQKSLLSYVKRSVTTPAAANSNSSGKSSGSSSSATAAKAAHSKFYGPYADGGYEEHKESGSPAKPVLAAAAVASAGGSECGAAPAVASGSVDDMVVVVD